MPQTLNVLLLVEDDENDIIITKRKIAKANLLIKNLLITRTLAETKELIKNQEIDAVLLDLNLPDSAGLDTLDGLRPLFDGIIVVLTSIDDEQVGIESIRRGADEYLVKSQLTDQTLAHAIFYSIERRKRWATLCRVTETLDKLDNALKK